MHNNIVVRCITAPDNEIKVRWEKLQQSSLNTTFLQYQWIATWLKSISPQAVLLEARCTDKVVGLAFVTCISHKTFFKLVKINQLWLHRTGQKNSDQVWIEHNDFLLHADYAEEARHAILNYIQTKFSSWHEFYVGVSPQSTIQKFSSILGEYRCINTSADYSVDLSKMNSKKDYLSSLSKNTRAQINRSYRLLLEEGDIKLQLATKIETKEQFFGQLAQYHQQKWRQTKEGSGFDNPKFVNFHKELIFTDVKNIYTLLYCLSINGNAMAYIYILKSEDVWSFYLSGVKPHKENKIKVGLIAHTLVIEQAINQGVTKYCFLAGDARYKKSLSNVEEEPQSLVCFNSHSKRMWCLQKLRWIKSLITASHSS